MNDPTPETPGDDAPQLHVDADWKAEAERERQRLAEAEAKARDAGGAAAGGEGQELPPADFRGLVSMLASQALMGLGTMTDPQSRGVIVDLEGSRFAIDLLGVLEEKTAGNLSEEESSELTQALGALRSRYVEIAQLVSQQMAGGGGAGGAGMPPGAAPGAPGGLGGIGGMGGPGVPGGPGGPGPIIDPNG